MLVVLLPATTELEGDDFKAFDGLVDLPVSEAARGVSSAMGELIEGEGERKRCL